MMGVLPGPEPQLPSAPFRRYLEERRRQYAREHGIDESEAAEGVAAQLSLSATRLRKYLTGNLGKETVAYATVDRVMGPDAREVYGATLELVNPNRPKDKKMTYYCQQCGTELRWKAELCGFCIEENKIDQERERLAA